MLTELGDPTNGSNCRAPTLGLQAEIEAEVGRIDVPCVNVFGHNLFAEPDRLAACVVASSTTSTPWRLRSPPLTLVTSRLPSD
ncbi:hypothetical protein AYO39_02500 [Actinobacteria bacterium SCGC AG-212-D09]|nr:hypothetical protein AYO39_02500 [Actinobacteria bacterium SCGC AG-212-D09]